MIPDQDRASSSRVRGAIAALLLAGCATVQPDASFPTVRQSARERLEQRVVWDRGGPEGQEIRAAVDQLLSRPLIAESAAQIALLNGAGLQAVFEELGVAQADLVQAGLVRNPSLAGFVRFPDRPPLGVNWNVGLDFWPLDIFLVPLRSRLAGAARVAAELRVSRAVLDVAARARVAYFALWADDQALAAQRIVADLADIAAELAQRQHRAGNIDDLRLAGERAIRQRALLALLEAESASRLSRERLRRVMGLSASDRSWSLTAEQTIPQGAEPDADGLVELALAGRPDLAATKKEIERLEYALALTRKWWLAPVRVGVETEKSSGGQVQTGPHFELEIPVFDQRQAEIARQEALIRQARWRVADLEGAIRAEVRSTLDRMRTARRIAVYYRDEVVPLRTRVTTMTEQRYQSMTLGIFEMLTAKSEEVVARISAVRAVKEFWTAWSDLELAIATRLPATEVQR